eukprot:TRINITY_DN2774_c0_g1_i7.p1 TRINITY_DN2774_c0_g1~~TRINITY_DN2774_c0_g1_i7.p1  ORF type:complete len:288 (-),score=45.75 TRINITY_DN2774_c0_g1_i7:557-1420(-)
MLTRSLFRLGTHIANGNTCAQRLTSTVLHRQHTASTSLYLRRLFSDSTDPNVNIFFATQTGTAQQFAKAFAREARKHKVKAKLNNLEDFEPDDVLPAINKADANIFFVSCYGHGEPPDSGKDFFDWLDNDQRGSDALKGMPFAVFGLGCSQTYPDRYQAVGKRLDQRLEQLGANRLLERGEGDDSGYIEDNFHDWKTEALPQLMTILKGSKGTDVSGGEVNVSPWCVVVSVAWVYTMLLLVVVLVIPLVCTWYWYLTHTHTLSLSLSVSLFLSTLTSQVPTIRSHSI